MHQTTYGEIHKTKIFDKKHVAKFLEEEKHVFQNILEYKNCIYPSTKVFDESSLNYLNTFSTSDVKTPQHQLKNIIKKEFDDCEDIYPYLGSVFLNLFFDQKILFSKKKYFFRKQGVPTFLKSIEDPNAREISEWIIKNSSFDRLISVKESFLKDINIISEDDIHFKIPFDRSFFGGQIDFEVKNYKYAIIDGFIESVGEIHHMLHFAAKSKEPHILFCFGMSNEVKSVIIENNKRKITQILPVSMSIDENTVNILNDIAFVHKTDVISSLKGQTISQEMRKPLNTGKKITFTEKGFKVAPLCGESEIRSHVKYLNSRILNAPPDTNVEVIRNRIENIHSKSLDIMIPKELAKSIVFNRSLDYFLRMIKLSKYSYYKVSIDQKDFMIPVSFFNYAITKVNNTKSVLYNIDKMLITTE